ncbi:MAG: hypothetical protein N2645_09295 [Clostridia bacterium]|nr:hypothetical protein [Clostridia bacterium]
MRKSFQFIPISQFKEKFPVDSWWTKYCKDFTDEDFLGYYDGDLTLPFLNLDWEKPFPQQKEVRLIFIDGNLTVDNLFNEGTDGAIGLMVMGNLNAKNMAVGGQEIYVKGNLTVEEILCGSYNHGETIVKGNLSSMVLIKDDEYRFKVDGEKWVPCTLSMWDGDGVLQEMPVEIQEVLIDEVFLDMGDEEECGFHFGSLVKVFEEGRSALKNLNEILKRKTPVSLYFTHNTPNEDNIMKLTRCILMRDDKDYFDFEEQGVYFKVTREHVDDDGKKQNPNIYIKDSKCCHFVYLEQDKSVSLLRKTIDEGAEWEDVTQKPQEELMDITCYWIMLLTCINVVELYLPGIGIKDLGSILQHPTIMALDPWGEENDGFWDGSKYYRFRQAHTDEVGNLLHARIEIQTPDEAFYFYVLDNETHVSRYYQPPYKTNLQDISYLDSKRWEASERYFEKFKKYFSKRTGMRLIDYLNLGRKRLKESSEENLELFIKKVESFWHSPTDKKSCDRLKIFSEDSELTDLFADTIENIDSRRVELEDINYYWSIIAILIHHKGEKQLRCLQNVVRRLEERSDYGHLDKLKGYLELYADDAAIDGLYQEIIRYFNRIKSLEIGALEWGEFLKIKLPPKSAGWSVCLQLSTSRLSSWQAPPDEISMSINIGYPSVAYSGYSWTINVKHKSLGSLGSYYEHDSQPRIIDLKGFFSDMEITPGLMDLPDFIKYLEKVFKIHFERESLQISKKGIREKNADSKIRNWIFA